MSPLLAHSALFKFTPRRTLLPVMDCYEFYMQRTSAKHTIYRPLANTLLASLYFKLPDMYIGCDEWCVWGVRSGSWVWVRAGVRVRSTNTVITLLGR